jgi:hypothetical protein
MCHELSVPYQFSAGFGDLGVVSSFFLASDRFCVFGFSSVTSVCGALTNDKAMNVSSNRTLIRPAREEESGFDLADGRAGRGIAEGPAEESGGVHGRTGRIRPRTPAKSVHGPDRSIWSTNDAQMMLMNRSALITR